MRHYGNISQIVIQPEDIVDVCIGGSPCQGLSVAGKRAGLEDERSGLFLEQIRVTKEMRELDKRINGHTGESVRPRYAVWENVPGAFSSNKGEDFRCVLESFAQIADPEVRIPVYSGGGGWPNSGLIVADGWSIAWRVLDTQYWGKTIRDRDTGNVLQVGTPQRRRRIALVADLGGRSAGKVLFESESMRGDSCQSEEAWEGTAADADGSVGGNGGVRCLNPWDVQSHMVYADDGAFASLYSASASGAQNCAVLIRNGDKSAKLFNGSNFGVWKSDDVIAPLTTKSCKAVRGDTPPCGSRDESILHGKWAARRMAEISNTLDCMHDQQAVCYDMTHACDVVREYKDVCPTLQHRMGTGGNQIPIKVDDAKPPRKYMVRRITPLECSRLQGLPDCEGGWCNVPPQESVSKEDLAFWRPLWNDWCAINGIKPKTDNQIIKWLMKPISESAQYEMYGNGIAKPPWQFVCQRVSEQYSNSPTMCSLFDGTGSFPLIWESINGKGAAVWSSEVNPDAVKVSKYRIG